MLHFVRLCLHWHGAAAESTVLEVKPLVVPMGSFPEVNLKSAGCFSFTKLSLKSQMYV